MNERNWELAVQLRGKSFQRNLDTYRMLTRWVVLAFLRVGAGLELGL
jgi:hypothetical protein